jgi:putative transposase
VTTGLKRLYGLGHLHFLTFSCYRRLPLLGNVRARDLFVQELSKVCDKCGFKLIGYVVMPEHVHLLISEPNTGTPSTVLHRLKREYSLKMRKSSRAENTNQPKLAFIEDAAPLRSFWQSRFYDFNVYTNRKKLEKLNYMHANPVIRGLVKHPKHWPWSRWGFYQIGEAGLLPIDVHD